MFKFKTWIVCAAILFTACGGQQQKQKDLLQSVKEVKLENGLTILMLKREGAPVFSARVQVKVGNVEEVIGGTGLAHFFEHMAFKGTDKIGTKNFKEEKKIIDQIHEVGTKLTLLKDKNTPEAIGYRVALNSLQKKQAAFIENNEFSKLYQKNGAVSFNATTSNDFTTYYASFPSNKLELWAYLESERLTKVPLREFFKERNVVGEERRMRVDNNPDGLLYEALIDKAFDHSPYRVHVIGKPEDIKGLTPKMAQDFYDRFYVPSRMVVTVVGNFDEDYALKTLKKYFSKIPYKPDTPRPITPQKFDKSFPRKVVIKGKHRPRLYLAYHRPAFPHKDDITLDVVRDLLCGTKSSRLYKRLVLEQRVASYVSCYASFPGSRLDSLFTFIAMPLDGHSNEKLISLIKKEIHIFKEEGPTPEEFMIVKNNIDADMIYSLNSNSGLAGQLSYFQSLTGNWRYMYHFRDRVRSMKSINIRTAMKKYFVPEREVQARYEQE